MLEYDKSLLQHALFERGFVIDLAEIKRMALAFPT